MLRVTLTSSALAALLMLTACDQPQDQRAQNGSSQIQPTTMDDTEARTAAIPVTEVQNPGTTLPKAAVKDSKGEAIGEVKSVSLDAGGKVQSVSVGVGTRTLALKPDGMTYAQAENALMIPQSKDEIEKMP